MNRSKALFILLIFTMGAVLASHGICASDRVDPQTVRNEIRNILSDSEYNRDYSSSVFMQKIRKAIGRAITRFYEWLSESLSFGGGDANRLVSFVLACIVIIAFLILVALIIRKLTGSVRMHDDDTHLDTASYDLPSSRPLIKEAARLAESADYRGAYRCAYLASISYLDEIKALRFERSRTNWEYLRELRQGGFDKPYGELHPLTLEFDRKFYGRENCSRDDYIKALCTYERIISEEAA